MSEHDDAVADITMGERGLVMEAVEMPRYRCHKEVRAMKIREVVPDEEIALLQGRESDGGCVLMFEGGRWSRVTRAWRERHQPKAGGYFVVYRDGYASWSPGDEFEAGYSRIE